MADTFGALGQIDAGGRSLSIARLDALAGETDVTRLPYTLRVLLENVLRSEALGHGSPDEVRAVAGWDAQAEPKDEISFRPARVLLQDFTGVPAIVDLAAMREAMVDLGGEAATINPQIPAELVIDHSVQVDEFGSRMAMFKNTEREFERNRERYAFLRWGQTAFDNFSVVPPNTGIVHQVNLEYLARVVESREDGFAFPDTLIGTDSHTTMINGLGVLGWGVGGIEAEAVLLGEPVSMLVPRVVGFRLTGELPEGATATDLVLSVTQILRAAGVVGKFVEYFGHGLVGLPLADRATIGNMSPEYGATCGFFPVDEETLRYLRLTGRPAEQVELVEAYCRAQGLFHDPDHTPEYSQVIELDLGDVEPSLAGPRRPQDRVPLTEAKSSFLESLSSFGVPYRNGSPDKEIADTFPASDPASTGAPGHESPSETEEEKHPEPVAVALAEPEQTRRPRLDGRRDVRPRARLRRHRRDHELHEHVEPVRDGRRRAAGEERGRARPRPQAVGEVEPRAGLQGRDRVLRQGRPDAVPRGARLPHGRLRLHDVHRQLGAASARDLGGGRGGRPRRLLGPLREPQLRGAHPPGGEGELPRLAAARRRLRARGSDRRRPDHRADRPGPGRQRRLPARPVAEPRAGEGDDRPGDLRGDVRANLRRRVHGRRALGRAGRARGRHLRLGPDSTYVRKPPYFDGMSQEPGTVEDVAGARCLVMVGDSVTTDHISPAGAIRPDSPAGKYLIEHGVERKDFNSYGSRRGNHEVMLRGTFANVRLRNLLVPGSEGTWTAHLPDGEEMTIFDAAERYHEEGVPLVVLAGKEYGSGSSRDWAAKGPNLLGVRAVIAETYERIHRSNLIGMGIVPLQYPDGESAESLGLTGREEFAVEGLENGDASEVQVTAKPDDGEPVVFTARVRLDTPRERDYLRQGGILLYALRKLAAG